MSITCRRCGSPDFRTSRFRLQDLHRLFFLQLPVRCRSCMLRDFVFLPGIFKIRHQARLRQRERAARGAQSSGSQQP